MASNEPATTDPEGGQDDSGVARITRASITFFANGTFPGTTDKFFAPQLGGFGNAYEKAALHEIGHTMGLHHLPPPNGCEEPNEASVINSMCNPNDAANNMPTVVKACDQTTINSQSGYTPGGCFRCSGTSCVADDSQGQYASSNCNNECRNATATCPPQYCGPVGREGNGCFWDPVFCQCECSPIIIDILGDGVSLTDVAGGVAFDLKNEGTRQQMSWTAANVDDGFLALDRNGNGLIDNGAELFGSFTPQPASEEPNGFIALAEYDKGENGGNGNGRIDGGDLVFRSLRVWIDADHNGETGAGELISLMSIGIESIELKYRESKWQDEFGNKFRYLARIRGGREVGVGRWAYDVFLKVAP